MSATFAVIVFIVTYALIASEKVARVPATLIGAGLLLATGVVHAHDSFFSEATGIDWNVIFLLLGMMIIVGITSKTGLFEYLGMQAVQLAKGKPQRVMVLLMFLTAAGSALLDNVTMILLTAPITLTICKRIGVPPIPFLLAQVFASNIGGAATIIGDPPNIIIGSQANLDFNDFIVNMAPIVIIVTVVLVLMCKWFFRSAFTSSKSTDELMTLNTNELIRDKILLVKCVVVLTGVLVGFVLHSITHIDLSVVALVGAGILIAISGVGLGRSVNEVEWETLVFFMGLFVITGALVKTGIIEDLGNYASDAIADHLLPGTIGLLAASGVLSGIVDNIPYTAAMSPLVDQVVSQQSNPDAGVLWWALALGADFGGNATLVGASANIVMVGIAKKHGYQISFWEFMKKGVPVTAMSLVLAGIYLWLRYFVIS